MARDVTIPPVIAAAGAVAFLTLSGAAARASEELCITCSGPEATYRCVLGETGQSVLRHGGVRAVQFVCISELARRGNHESCRVRRDARGPCLGDVRAVASAADEWAPAVTPEGQLPKSEKAGEPKTVEELARRSVEASRKQLQQAGTAAGSAAKKTWDCVAAMFRRC